MKDKVETKSNYKIIVTILSVNFLLLMGNSITGFAIASYLYQGTGKVSNIGILYLLQLLPGMLIKLFTGILIDGARNKKLIMVISDILCAFNVLVIFFEYINGSITNYSIYLYIIIFSLLASIKSIATTVVLTPYTAIKYRSKVNAFIDISQVLPRLVGPVIGSYLYTHDVKLIFIIDCIGHILSAIIISYFAKEKLSKIDKISYSFRDYFKIFKSQKEVLHSTICLAFLEFQSCLIGVYIYPILLNIIPINKIGIILSIGGVGTMIGGGAFILIKKGLPSKASILYCILSQGIFLCAFSFFNHIVIKIFFFVAFFSLTPIIRGSCNAIIQNVTPIQSLGGIVSLNVFILQFIACNTFLLGGYAADFLQNLLINKLNIVIVNPNYSMYILIFLAGIIVSTSSLILLIKSMKRLV